MDLLIVGIIVLAAVVYMARRMVRSAKTKSCGGCCSCSASQPEGGIAEKPVAGGCGCGGTEVSGK